MDAFFAAIEMRDFPQYRGKPLIVGGSPHSRGVVSTCSYEARKYGIHSAMPSFLAYKLCPSAIFVSGRYEVYGAVGRRLQEILLNYTPVVEAVSIDEAYLDVTQETDNLAMAVDMAKEMKDHIKRELELTASAGVSYNKFLAKIASEMEKPDGLFLINGEQAIEILEQLEIGKFHGIGKATAEKMNLMGIRTGKDLKMCALADLVKQFGKSGKYYYEIVRGIDKRKVSISRERKSLGKERTFSHDLFDEQSMQAVLRNLVRDVSQELISKNIKGKTITVKIKYNDFSLFTRSFTKEFFVSDEISIYRVASKLLSNNLIQNKGVRLLGVSLSNLDTQSKGVASEQQLLDFFSDYDHWNEGE